MAVSLPRIAQLLAKAGISAQTPEGGPEKSALAADKSGLQKGQVIDADGKVVVGLGYNPADRAKAGQNLHEKSSVDAFVKALKGETPSPGADAKAKTKEGEGDKSAAQAEAPARPTAEEAPGRKELRELREERQQEVRREERQDDARAQGQKEAKEQAESRDHREVHDHLRVERDKPDDDDKHGHAYAFLDPEEDQEDGESGYRSAEVFADAERCHGLMEDGTRCIRRAREGRPFCRAHVVRGPDDPMV